jgi:hypothetical protein
VKILRDIEVVEKVKLRFGERSERQIRYSPKSIVGRIPSGRPGCHKLK